MKTVYVKDLKKTQIIVGETFLISSCEKAADKNGKDYYKVTLADKTGKIEAKIWSDALPKIDRKLIEAGKLVGVTGKVDEYRGNLQLTINDFQPIDETKMDDYLETSKFDPEEMLAELLETINAIKHAGLRNVLLKIINDPEMGRKIKYWPAAKTIHHEFRSGMLQHIMEMIYISRSLKKFYPEVNYDILTAGIILHDIGKLDELGSSPLGTTYSKSGILMGHIIIGLLLFDHFGGRELPEDIYLHVCHLILSHHGTREYGSPVLPSTVEAVMLTYIDNLSSKARGALSAVQKIPVENEFSDFNRWFDGVQLWRGGNSEETKEVTIEHTVEYSEEITVETDHEDNKNEDPNFEQLQFE